MFVTGHLIPIHYRMEIISAYRFSYIMYFWSYYGNPVLSLYVMSWICFQPLQIKPIICNFKIKLSCMLGSLIRSPYSIWDPVIGFVTSLTISIIFLSWASKYWLYCEE